MNVSATLFAPPWVDVLPSGERVEYGPKSLATYAAHVAKYKLWSWRLPSKEARQDGDVLIAYVRLEDGSFRPGIPAGELRVYRLVCEEGHSTRYAARALNISRSTVKTALRRLRARVGK